MSRSNWHVAILKRIRIGRFEYIGVDNSTPPVFYVGYGIPPLWTRVENVHKHFALNRDTQERLQEMLQKVYKRWEKTNDAVERTDRGNSDIGDQACDQ